MRLKPRLLGRLSVLAVACAGGALAVGAPVASAETNSEVSCAAITASGSSLQNLAQKEVWTKDYTTTGWKVFNAEQDETLKPSESYEHCTSAPSITYEPTSSGKGLAEWGDGGTLLPAESFNKTHLDGFVGTDVGPEGAIESAAEGTVEAGTQIAEMDKAGEEFGGSKTLNKVMAVPVATSAISVIVSLPVGCELTKSTTKAFMHIAKLWEVWDTDTVKYPALIGGSGVETTTACEVAPKLQAREVASGTTAGFKRYLDDLESVEFGPCTKTAAESESASCWPNASNKEESGNETGGELAKKVYETAGTIGYADLADAVKAGFGSKETSIADPEKHGAAGKEYYSFVVLMRNGTGTTAGEGSHEESPEVSNGGSNCEKATFPAPKKVGPNIDWSRARQSNSTTNTSTVYPLCTLTFDVAWEHYGFIEEIAKNYGTGGKADAETANTVFNYLRWIVTEGETGTTKTELEEKHFAPVPGTATTGVLKEDREGVTVTNTKL